jgi:hypothetical protein
MNKPSKHLIGMAISGMEHQPNPKGEGSPLDAAVTTAKAKGFCWGCPRSKHKIS